MASELYRELCSRVMVPDSARMARIWEILCDQDEARLLLAMPATLSELAEKTGRQQGRVEQMLDALFRKGVAFEAAKPEGIVYRGPRHIIQLHDASVQWLDAPQEFYDVWKEFMAIEYPPLLSMILSSGVPSFMRVVPALGSIQDLPDVLLHEHVGEMIEAAEEIAVCRCPCRLTEKNCDNALRTCIQFNNGARYNIKRGTGDRISKDEAMDIVRESEDAGLVHGMENRPGMGNVLCNCCTCCCAIIRQYRSSPGLHRILASSRFQARAAADLCSSDGLCKDICPVDAITLDEAAGARVDGELCIGCGLCATACPTGAMSLKIIRPAEFIGQPA